ncbi:MAG TPA: hypothetical protein VGN33_10505 [Leifsonia sp.]|jgi:hypothetical protein|nr:hypothetical protein [Leifsonia sp.]
MAAESNETQERIDSLLRSETGLLATWDTPPEWLGLLITGLSLAVGEEEIIYLGASFIAPTPDSLLRVGIFTPDMLITAEVSGISTEGHKEIRTVVQARADLVRFEVSGGASSFDADELDEWPGGFSIRAIYASGLEVIVPSSVVDTNAKRHSVNAVLAGLRSDLRGYNRRHS